ncbi:uncharacterized protein LOC111068538 isoform X2 [Drosophila obscura]|uniref:uncharacterized protein LOC111068538 isoform X2 n=1 Tax=Drosophila obscura TaxID=7282 RepID=UPI001BB2A44D|nr:uncharacterized protein LOC111068538 isoform X2 [Drosophila obscura]
MSDSSDIEDSSYHSFDRSKSSDHLDASSSCGSENGSEDALQNLAQTYGLSLASSSEDSYTIKSSNCTTITDHDSSIENGDETSVVEPQKQRKPKGKLSNWHKGSGKISPRKMPPVSYVLPNVEAFSLDRPTSTLKERVVAGTSRKSEATQKILYTGNWVDSQLIQPKCKVSPRKQFDLVFDAYKKNKSANNYASTSTFDQPKETASTQQTVSSNQSKPVEEEEEEEYVSPFKDMPPQPRPKESPLLAGQKKPLVLPAGYDLSSLQVIKNPNHWSLRPGVRTGDIIY